MEPSNHDPGSKPLTKGINDKSAIDDKKKKAPTKCLPSLLRYFIDEELTVELKSGQMIRGVLSRSDEQMNVTLESAVMLTSQVRTRQCSTATRNSQSPPPENGQGRPSTDWDDITITSLNEWRPDYPLQSPLITTSHNSSLLASQEINLSVVQIRGSKIRYIHFPDQLNLSATIKKGMDRERSALQRYQRGIRK